MHTCPSIFLGKNSCGCHKKNHRKLRGGISFSTSPFVTQYIALSPIQPIASCWFCYTTWSFEQNLLVFLRTAVWEDVKKYFWTKSGACTPTQIFAKSVWSQPKYYGQFFPTVGLEPKQWRNSSASLSGRDEKSAPLKITKRMHGISAPNRSTKGETCSPQINFWGSLLLILRSWAACFVILSDFFVMPRCWSQA